MPLLFKKGQVAELIVEKQWGKVNMKMYELWKQIDVE